MVLASATWDAVWTSFAQQLDNPDFGVDDHLVLVLGEASVLATNLRACCERTTSAADEGEYSSRLTEPQQQVISTIVAALAQSGRGRSFVHRLLSRTQVEIFPDDIIDRDIAPLWMPEAPIARDRLLAILRDIAGGASRVRGSFDAVTLRDRLNSEHDIAIIEPSDWGVAHYRAVLRERAVIEVPGTSVVKRLTQEFLWPKATRYDRTRRPDFDDETPRHMIGVRSDEIDLSLFPAPNVDHVVVIAGPGLGKSVLIAALSAQAVTRGLSIELSASCPRMMPILMIGRPPTPSAMLLRCFDNDATC